MHALTLRLAGRHRELAELAAALEDPETVSVCVRGPSGAGKTALVESVLAEHAAAGVIVGRGRYPDGGIVQGLRPILEAMSRATEAALDQLYDPASGAQSLSSMLGERLVLLFDAGFQPEGIRPPGVSRGDGPLANRESAARLIDAVLRVMRWLDGFGAPLILFIDDWHRAPREAQVCIAAMAREAAGRLCTLVLAGREEGGGTQIGPRIVTKTIRLGPLAREEQIELLASATGDGTRAAAIVDWLSMSASGLPLDLLEAARALAERSALSQAGGRWHVDERAAATIDRMDLAKTIVERARRLTPEEFDLAVAIGIWSGPITIDLLARLMTVSDDRTEEMAGRLGDAGLVERIADTLFIRHDRIRAALLGGIGAEKVRTLAERMSAQAAVLDEKGWLKVERSALRLRLLAGIEGAVPGIWRDRFAAASEKGRRTADFAAATDFAEAAWRLRTRERPLRRSSDRLILREALISAANRRHVALTRERSAQLIDSAICIAEICEAHEWSAAALRLAGDLETAWECCMRGLSHFDIHMPKNVGKIDLVRAIAGWRLAGLQRRRTMREDDSERAFIRFGQTATTIGWERSPATAAFIAIKAAARARRLGQQFAFWTMTDAFISASIGDYARASALGAEAIPLLNANAVRRGLSLYTALFFGSIWTEPLEKLQPRAAEIYELSLGEGDLVGAAYAVRMEAMIAWRTGRNLSAVMETLKACDLRAEQLGDAITRAEITRLIALVGRIVERAPTTTDIPLSFLTKDYSDPPVVVLQYLSFAHDWPSVLRIAGSMKAQRQELNSHPGSVIWRFHENLARLRQGMAPRRCDMRFIARAAALNPADHRAKLLLLEAEDLRRRGRASCGRAYAEAVEAATLSSSRLEAGLAAECAASAALVFGDAAGVDRFRSAAQEIWRDWGALSKLTQQTVGVSANNEESTRLFAAESRAAMSERAERAKSRFLAEVGHELRTPLQGMQSLLDLACEAPERVKFDEVRDVFGSLKSVVDDLTELGALGSGAPLNLRQTNLVALLKSELAITKATASGRHINFASDLQFDADAEFELDGARVRQVVRNLLSNAIKYAGEGWIGLRMLARQADGDTADIEIAVEDSGPGIREADLPRLFEPFERAGRDDERGLGLGLSVARKIAERMKGSLTAANRPEGGTRFVFSFSASVCKTSAARSVTMRPRRILLVEDTPLVRRGLASLLRRDGHVVAETGTVAEALEMAAEDTFDVLLLDLRLPDGDGLSLLDKIRSRHTQSVPAIILTASTAPETAERVRDAGALLLSKPISAEDLRHRLAELLGFLPDARTSDNGPEDPWSALSCEARSEIVRRGVELVAMARTGASAEQIGHSAHRLAGLAAQFHSPRIAALADRVEATSRSAAFDVTIVEALAEALETAAG